MYHVDMYTFASSHTSSGRLLNVMPELEPGLFIVLVSCLKKSLNCMLSLDVDMM